MIKKQIGLFLCVLLILGVSGCNKENEFENNDNNYQEITTSAVSEDDYDALLPFRSLDSSTKGEQSASLLDSFNISFGLMELSKEYFSTSKHTYKESQFLTYDILDASVSSTGLLGHYDPENNPMGMNPQIDSEMELQDGANKKITENDNVINNIYELDWYESKELRGISIAVVLNNKIGEKKKPDTLSDQALHTYGEEVSGRVVEFLREKYPQIGDTLPIYVALYQLSGAVNELPGVFVADSYYETGMTSSFEKIDESWLLYPSENSTNHDSTNVSDFESFANEVRKFFPEDTSVIGKGHYRDGTMVNLNIDIVMHAKSGAEVNAAVQQINSKLSAFTSTDYELRVSIKCDTESVAVIARNIGNTETNVISLIE